MRSLNGPVRVRNARHPFRVLDQLANLRVALQQAFFRPVDADGTACLVRE
jgi:hypothetical protein